ncbi:Smr/MutS family protein [soil metagenome]
MTRSLKPDEVRLWQTLTDRVAPPADRRPGHLSAEDERLWRAVTAGPTLRPARPPSPAPSAPAHVPSLDVPALGAHRPAPKPHTAPSAIEPGRHRRLAREREPIDATLDLHGLDQDRARSALTRFIAWEHEHGARAVLIVTGKGLRSGGVIYQRAPEWLADPALRSMVAGVSRADPRHGGEGALYVALKRRIKA